MKHYRSTDTLESQLEKSQQLVSQLNNNCRDYRLKLDLANKKLSEAATKAEHFDILIKAVNENAVVRSAWDKFMMALRMTGYDRSQ